MLRASCFWFSNGYICAGVLVKQAVSGWCNEKRAFGRVLYNLENQGEKRNNLPALGRVTVTIVTSWVSNRVLLWSFGLWSDSVPFSFSALLRISLSWKGARFALHLSQVPISCLGWFTGHHRHRRWENKYFQRKCGYC